MEIKGSISNVEEYIRLVEDIYANWNVSNKHLFFRGQGNDKWNLKPSLLRNKYNEREITLDFKQVSPTMSSDYSSIDDIDKMLVEMQHYGVPTRLLDWTFAPLIALFFACLSTDDETNDKKNDAVVFVLNPWNAYKNILNNNRLFYSNGVLPNTYMDISIISRALLAYKWSNEEIVSYIKRKYDHDISNVAEFKYTLPFVAKYRNDRIVAQRGAFTIWGTEEGDLESQSMIYNNSNMVIIKVDASSKSLILDELNKLYINEYTIYPDYQGMCDLINRRGGLFNLNRI